MKKVLVISSSARKGGNSDTLCDEFVKGATKAGHTVQKIRLAEKNIGFCTGCGACETTHKCVLDDDMAGILDLMQASDVIVLATPVYFYAMCGRLKNMIDRMVSRETAITSKDFYFILTAADTNKANVHKVVDELHGLTELCLSDAREKGIIYGLGVWQVGDINGNPALEQAYEAGKQC